jgi:hypothetical protein
MNNDIPTNNNYLAGYLSQTMRNLPNVFEREGIIKWNSPEYKKVMDLIDKELKRAHEAERDFSKR